MNKSHSNSQCRPAEPYYYDYLHNRKNQIPQAVCAHIVDCSDCQREIQWLHQLDNKTDKTAAPKTRSVSHAIQMKLHSALVNQPVRCSDIKSFLPILAISEMGINISTPVTKHIKACAECEQDLETLKNLNLSDEQLSCLSQIISYRHAEQAGEVDTATDTFFQGISPSVTAIRKIIDRPDSDVVTHFEPDNICDAAFENPGTTIANPADSVTDISQETQQSRTGTRFKWWLKPIAAAAAVVIIASLLLNNSSVEATDLGQIYEALKSVQNVVMTQYDANTTEPVQTISISRSQGIKLRQANGEFVLFDIKNKIKKSKNESNEETQQIQLDRNTFKSVYRTMNVPYGLLPFNSQDDLPKGAIWKQVQSEKDSLNSEQSEIYDLFWSENTTGSDFEIHYQWRCHLDPVTKHPFRLELWTHGPIDSDYVLTSTTEITYPTKEQMDQMITQIGF